MKIIRVKCEPAPSWLASSVGRALHRYRKSHGFKSRTSLNFRSSQIWFLHIYSQIKKDVNKPVKI